MKQKLYYFAYGSNLSHRIMLGRRPDSIFFSCAKLSNHQLVFDGYHKRSGGAVANIVPTHDSSVWGGLYLVSKKGVDSLHDQENYPVDYDVKMVEVETPSGEMIRAFTYWRLPRTVGIPGEKYVSTILEGVSDCGISMNHIPQELRRYTHPTV